tara:strand:+ start:444 stop:1094 length:651 start_codon:yes stop_codon:yes gene_type:complete
LKSNIIIIDYGVGNLLSIGQAVERCGFKVSITSDEKTISKASHIILPGVGAFGYAMNELKKRNLDKIIMQSAKKGINILGICLGMQLLFNESLEFGNHEGLKILEGEVIPIPSLNSLKNILKIPNIGWYELQEPKNLEIFKKNLLFNISYSKFVYFVHSFMCKPINTKNILAYYDFSEIKIPAIVKKNNIFGCQFHPEKSGEVGLKIIDNFCNFNE